MFDLWNWQPCYYALTIRALLYLLTVLRIFDGCFDLLALAPYIASRIAVFASTFVWNCSSKSLRFPTFTIKRGFFFLGVLFGMFHQDMFYNKTYIKVLR